MINCTGLNCPMQKGYDNVNCKIADDCPYVTRPATRADVIRAISDEDLAVMFAVLRADLSKLDAPVRSYSGLDVNKNYDWLKMPASGLKGDR